VSPKQIDISWARPTQIICLSEPQALVLLAWAHRLPGWGSLRLFPAFRTHISLACTQKSSSYSLGGLLDLDARSGRCPDTLWTLCSATLYQVYETGGLEARLYHTHVAGM